MLKYGFYFSGWMPTTILKTPLTRIYFSDIEIIQKVLSTYFFQECRMISKVGMRQCLDRAAHLPFADEQRKVTRLKLGRDEELLTEEQFAPIKIDIQVLKYEKIQLIIVCLYH